MAEGELKDWRGTPIRVGCRVVTHALGKIPQRTIGTVSKVNPSTGSVTVEVEERDIGYRHGKYTVLGSGSVLVLSAELFHGIIRPFGAA
jgi:hypothetical protein